MALFAIASVELFIFIKDLVSLFILPIDSQIFETNLRFEHLARSPGFSSKIFVPTYYSYYLLLQTRLIPNWIFLSVSWLLLFGAMVTLVAVAREVHQAHLAPQAVQKFSFSDPAQVSASESVNLSEVTRQHIFGVVPPIVKPVVEQPKIVEAPKTQLKLSLTGVITAKIPEESRAMVEIKRGETSVVKVGEAIGKTGATLKEVHKDHILIEHRGKPEKLEIVRPEMKFTDLSAQAEGTISSLNINVAEFEALAKVDPRDLDISKLLPAAPKKVVENESVEGVDSKSLLPNQNGVEGLALQQLQELEALDRQEEIDELQGILDGGGLEQAEIDQLENELIQLRSQ